MALRSAIAALACIAASFSDASGVYGPEDAESLKHFVLQRAGSDGGFAGNLLDARFGVEALALLGAKGELQAQALCSLAASALASDSVELATAFHAASILDAARCPDAAAKDKAKKVAMEGLQTEATTTQASYQALSTLAYTGAKASQEEIRNALLAIQKLKTSRGQLRSVAKGPASLGATAYGYLAIAQAKAVGSIGQDMQPAVDELLAGIPQVLEAISKRPTLSEGASFLEAAVRFVQGVEATCPEDCSLNVQQLGALAKLLTRAKSVGSVEDACYVVAGLKSLSTSGNLPKPAALDLASPTLSPAQGELTLLVRDYAGNPVEPSSVTGSIRRGKGGGGGDLTFVSQGQGAYTASVSGLGLGMGNHQVSVEAAGESGKLASELLEVTMTGKAEISSATVSVKNLESSAEKLKTQLQFPDKLTKPVKLDHRSQLKVVFTANFADGKPFTPQQAFVSLKSAASGALVVLAAKAGKSAPNDFSLSFTADSIASQVGPQVGEYEMVVTVGDDALEAGVRWPLGMVTISPAAGNSGAKASAAVPTAAQLDAQPKPEIHHIFRKPDRRPPAAISMLFATAAVAIPAAYLLIRLSQLGVNLKGFPIGGMASTATVAFHAGIASILGLYAVFWLRLTIIDTLLPLAGLSLFTFLAGFKALSHHARAEMGSPAHPPVVLKRE